MFVNDLFCKKKRIKMIYEGNHFKDYTDGAVFEHLKKLLM